MTRIREVICRRWLLAKWIEGIVIYPFIFYQGQPSKIIRKHEWVHVAQIRRVGVIRWYITYLYYNCVYGYERNPYEIEAYEKSNNEADH